MKEKKIDYLNGFLIHFSGSFVVVSIIDNFIKQKKKK